MSKRLIWIVTVIMGLAMAALILVQAYWIKNAIIVKEKQFDQLIMRSMWNITNEIEMLDISKFAARLSRPALTDTTTVMAPLPPSVPHSQNTDSASKEEIRQWLRNRREFVERIIASQYYASPRIERRISQAELENVIHKVFTEFSIDIPYEYAVLRWNNDTAYRSELYSPLRDTESYRVQLFPNETYARPNYLKLYFPDKSDFLYQSLGYLAISSLVLSLAILVSFTITVFIMFRQKRLSEIRNDFISNMTHELKTPISTISLASQMLGDKSIPLEIKNMGQISKIISEECRRLSSQVEKVLQTSVFEKGRLKLRYSEIDMHEIIGGVVENFSIQIKNRNGVINVELNAEEHILQADQVHITNVMSNLLDNAIKYTTNDPEITVTTLNKPDFFVVTVKDNGIGIARNDQKRVFEKFYRVPTGNIHTVKGFGLGLSYVKMVAEAHEGYVELDSELYKGSAFKVYLPIKANDSHAKD